MVLLNYKENHLTIDNSFDLNKRKTLKVLTGITTTGLLASMPILSKAHAELATYNAGGDIIDCTLISRSDLSRAYLLIHNRTDSDVVAARFNEELIQFDNTTLNMADAYVEPVVIPSNDRLMIRLNIEAGIQNEPFFGNIINMNANTEYLSQGTRVVTMKLRIKQGVCSIEPHSLIV